MLQSIGKVLSGGSTTTLFTVPDGYHAIVIMVKVINTTANQHSYSMTWHDGVSITVQATKNLAAESYQVFFSTDNPLVMQEGDYISVTTAATSSFTAIATVDILRNEKTPYNL